MFNRAESPAAEFPCYGVRPSGVAIYHAGQSHRHSFFRQLLVDTRMIAPECANADHGNVNEMIRIHDLLLRLLQQRDLPRMVKIVLHDPTE